jgi:hypothetical protein
MELCDALFPDQDLETLLTELEPPEGSPLHVRRALLWEGRSEEAASVPAGTGGSYGLRV